MSFRCDFCGQPEANGVAANKVVTKIRHRRYPNTNAVGSEIVEEKTACSGCDDPDRPWEVIPLPDGQDVDVEDGDLYDGDGQYLS